MVLQSSAISIVRNVNKQFWTECASYQSIYVLTKLLFLLPTESGAYSTKNVSELRKLAPHVTEILQKPPSIHSTLGIANPYKNYTAEEGFWEIQAKQFPLFFCVIDKETEEWHYDAINSYHSINDMSSDDDGGAFMDYL